MKRKCKNCNRLFSVTARHPDQKYCSRKECRKTRKIQWQRRKLSSDEDYRKNQADCQSRWRAKNPGYWKRYREKHPESAQQNREKQRERNRIKRSQPSPESILPTIANMDMKNQQKPLVSGYYELTPIAGQLFANMDAIVVRINKITDSRVYPVKFRRTAKRI